MSALTELLKAAGEVSPLVKEAPLAWVNTKSLKEVVPAMQGLVGRVSQAENPAQALSRALAVEELISAKAGAKIVREGRKGAIEGLGSGITPLKAPDLSDAFGNKPSADLQKLMADNPHVDWADPKAWEKYQDEIMAKDVAWLGAKAQEANALMDNLKPSPKLDNMMKFNPEISWGDPAKLKDELAPGDFKKLTDSDKVFLGLDEFSKGIGGSKPAAKARYNNPDLYRKSGLKKIMSFHEGHPDNIARMIEEAEGASKGVEGGVEPALTLPSFAHVGAPDIAAAGGLPGNFGKVAFIGDAKTVGPKAPGAETFDSDAYVYRRPKGKPVYTKDGKAVTWMGERHGEEWKEDPNLVIMSLAKQDPGVDPRFADFEDLVVEFPKNMDRGDVIDALKLQDDDYHYKNWEDLPGYTKGIDQTGPIPESSKSNYIKPLSPEERPFFTITTLTDQRTGKEVWVKIPTDRQKLIDGGFTITNHKDAKFPDMDFNGDGGRWLSVDDPEALRAHLKERMGGIRFTEGFPEKGKIPSGYSSARGKYATPITSEAQLRISLSSGKHKNLSSEEMNKLEQGGQDFFDGFNNRAREIFEQEKAAYKNSAADALSKPGEFKSAAFPGTAPTDFYMRQGAHEYLERLEQTGTGGNRELDKLGLQYLIYMKSVPTNYYEGKIFRNIPLKDTKAVYMPPDLYEAGVKLEAEVARWLKEGWEPARALDQAVSLVDDHQAKHALVIIRAMKKRGVPIVSDMGDLLKYAWAIPIIGPGSVYVAGDKKKK